MRRPCCVPVSLSRSIDPAALSRENPSESVTILGSFWPYSTRSYESRLVKGFKECNPTTEYQPHILQLCKIYSQLIIDRLPGKSFDWLVRVLGSTELRPDPMRPLALLESILCEQLGAESLTHLFYKTESRPAMRLVGQLSGPDALKERIRHAAQDLFITRSSLGGRALLLDDIYNTGASMRVYASALKGYAGVDSVMCVNLAATRFKAGKDDHGWLRLDTTEFESCDGLRLVWTDNAGFFHATESCAALDGAASVMLRFLAEKRAEPCRTCCPTPNPKSKLQESLRPA